MRRMLRETMKAGPGVSDIWKVKKKWCDCQSDLEGEEGCESAREEAEG